MSKRKLFDNLLILPADLNTSLKLTKNPIFPALTGVRAIAAYLIFVHHYLGSNCSKQIWCSLVLEAHFGVSIFFVLSGFLITYNYYDSSQFSWGWFKKYYIQRFSRIYPLYFFLAVITLVVLHPEIIEWILSLTLTQGLFSKYRFIGVSQSWTLTVEFIFYFIAPIIFLLHKNKATLVLQFLLIFLIGILISSKGQIYDLGGFLSGHLFLFIYTFFGRCFEFFCGIFLGLIILKREVYSTKIYTYLGLVGILSTLYLITTYQSEIFRFGIYSPLGLVIYLFVLPVMIGIFLLGLIKEKTYISKFLSTRLMVLLGQSSYAFYLIHLPPVSDLLPGFLRLNLWIFFISLNFFSILLFLFLEKPANNFIRKNSVKLFS